MQASQATNIAQGHYLGKNPKKSCKKDELYPILSFWQARDPSEFQMGPRDVLAFGWQVNFHTTSLISGCQAIY